MSTAGDEDNVEFQIAILKRSGLKYARNHEHEEAKEDRDLIIIKHISNYRIPICLPRLGIIPLSVFHLIKPISHLVVSLVENQQMQSLVAILVVVKQCVRVSKENEAFEGNRSRPKCGEQKEGRYSDGIRRVAADPIVVIM
jgi:hypothetical protein